MGITAYHVPIPMVNKFTTTVPVPMSKYLSAGVLSQQEVLCTQLAEKGYIGDTEPLTGDYGFWKAFGCDEWNPELLTGGLGRTWHFPGRVFYKTFPCCGAMQNTIAHFMDIIDENDLQPEDISEVTVKLGALAELPVWRTKRVETHMDAQFSVPFVFSVAAHRIEIGPAWQMEETIKDHRISEFMEKVRVITPLDDMGRQRADVEVTVGHGASRNVYTRTGIAWGSEMTDTGLFEKFRRNSCSILGEDQAEKVAGAIRVLEDFTDFAEILNLINGG
jgi:2-methylcitrate dehydratase PrpD